MRNALVGALLLWLFQGGSALALDAPGLLAEWQKAAQTAGATLTYNAAPEGANQLLVTALTLQSTGALPFTLSLPKLHMESLADGRVKLTPEGTFNTKWGGGESFWGEGDTDTTPEGLTIWVSRGGTATYYSGAAAFLRAESRAQINMPDLSKLLPKGADAPMPSGAITQTVTLEGWRMALVESGGPVRRLVLLNDIEKANSEGILHSSGPGMSGEMRTTSSQDHLSVRSLIRLPAGVYLSDLAKPETWFKIQSNGVSIVAEMTAGGLHSKTTNTGAALALAEQDMETRVMSEGFSIGPEGVALWGEMHGFHNIQKDQRGKVVDFSAGYLRVAAAAPLISEDAQEVDFGFDVDDLSFSPETWAQMDSAGVFTPLPMDIALHLGLRLRADLPALIAAASDGSKAPQPQVDSVTLRKLAFNGLGIDLQSDGGLAFDMSKTPPLRSGVLHTELKGSQNLIAALEAKGFLQGEMLMGLRFVMSAFFKAEGEDHLTSDIKIDEGLLTLNGVKIGGLENLPFPN